MIKKAESLQEFTLDNPEAVVEFLKKSGFQISRPSLYRHLSEGKLRRRPDGSFTHRALNDYAKNFLRTLGGRRFQKTGDAKMHIEHLRSELSRFIEIYADILCKSVDGDFGKLPALIALATGAAQTWMPAPLRKNVNRGGQTLQEKANAEARHE